MKVELAEAVAALESEAKRNENAAADYFEHVERHQEQINTLMTQAGEFNERAKQCRVAAALLSGEFRA